MVAWTGIVPVAGWLADRLGRKPLLFAGWIAMAANFGLLAVSRDRDGVLGVQLLDELAQGLFAVGAAAWVTDLLADPRRASEAQSLVGTCLVLGSAIGPALSTLVVPGGSLASEGQTLLSVMLLNH